MDAADTVRAVRRTAGLSLRDLAELADTSHATLSAYEHGRKVPRADTLLRICRATGHTIVIEPDPLAAVTDREERGRQLLDVLRLADAFPFERSGPLDAPVFPRQPG